MQMRELNMGLLGGSASNRQHCVSLHNSEDITVAKADGLRANYKDGK